MSAAPSFFSGAVCPACGQSVELPRITPEMLFFKASKEGAALPAVASFMPDGSRAVAFAGVIYAMPADEWARFLEMRRNWAALPLDQLAA